MRIFLILLLLVLPIGLYDPSWADSKQPSHPGPRGYLKQDPLFKDRTNIYDHDGHKKGYMEQDPLFKDRTNIYDQSGVGF